MKKSSELLNNLKKQTATAIHKKYPENTPMWHIEMIQPFVKTTITSPTPKNIEFIYFDPNEERNNFIREHTTNNLHKAYTDGSEKNKKMGSAIIKINENEMKQKILIQPSLTNPSAQKAEITAIYASNLTTQPKTWRY